MSRQDPHTITRFAWRAAWLGLIGVLSVTVSMALWIANQDSASRLALAPEKFDERWQIRSGAAIRDRLVLNPTADSIGVALRPVDPQVADFTLQTRVTFNQPADTAGLIVQAEDADHFVAFLISPDGYFRLSDYRNGVWIDRVAWRAWPHIHRDGSPNVLRSECRGGTCTFFVNDEWTWQAESIAPTSGVGIVATAGLDTRSGEAVVVDQFALRSP